MLNVQISSYGLSLVTHVQAMGNSDEAILVSPGMIMYVKRAELAPVLFPVEYTTEVYETPCTCGGWRPCEKHT